MKRTPIRRKTPLRRSRWMRRRPSGTIPLQTREALVGQSGNRCDKCRRPGWDVRLEAHHKRLRSQGGTDEIGNLALLCSTCHRDVHANPAEAARSGWIVRAGA